MWLMWSTKSAYNQMVQILLQTVSEVNLQDNEPEIGTLNGPLDRVYPLKSGYDFSLSKTLTQLRPLFLAR